MKSRMKNCDFYNIQLDDCIDNNNEIDNKYNINNINIKNIPVYKDMKNIEPEQKTRQRHKAKTFNMNDLSFLNEKPEAGNEKEEETIKLNITQAEKEEEEMNLNEERERSMSDLNVNTSYIEMNDENEESNIKMSAEEIIISQNNIFLPSEKRTFYKIKNNLVSYLASLTSKKEFTPSYLMALGIGYDENDEISDASQNEKNDSIIEVDNEDFEDLDNPFNKEVLNEDEDKKPLKEEEDYAYSKVINNSCLLVNINSKDFHIDQRILSKFRFEVMSNETHKKSKSSDFIINYRVDF